MRILVVCGAGASSTFVAQRINGAARRRNRAYTATATDERRLPEAVDSSDLILLGPHLAPRFESIRDLAAPHGVGVLLLTRQGDIAFTQGELLRLSLFTRAGVALIPGIASAPAPTATDGVLPPEATFVPL